MQITQQLIDQVEKEAISNLKKNPFTNKIFGKLGTCHLIWGEMKQIFKEKI